MSGFGYNINGFGSFPSRGGPYDIQFLVVAGGGAGGGVNSQNYASGGGGGAGGYIATTASQIARGLTFTVVVGAGGAEAVTDGYGNVGATSRIQGTGLTSPINSSNNVLANGGAGGAPSESAGGLDRTGTSGGGGGSSLNTSTNAGGSASGSGDGNAGGYGHWFNAPQAAYNRSLHHAGGGGGGGAGAAGVNCTNSGVSTYGGNGGAGKQWLNSTYYAGGGGGAVWVNTDGGQGSGGNGGGGAGGYWRNYNTAATAAVAGTANTGGGGGGAPMAYGSSSRGGHAGGSGVVIVRYEGDQVGTGGTVSSAGGYTYHTFTSSGNFATG